MPANVNIDFTEPLVNYQDIKDYIMINNNKIDSMIPADPLQRSFIIKPSIPLSEGTIYTLIAGKEVIDFAGNRMERSSFSFGIPDQVVTGDISFNELLFNPLPGDPDYIEFYSSSERIINAGTLFIASVNETGDTSELKSVSERNRCILPGLYYAITTDRERVISRYFSSGQDNIFTVGMLPSMPDYNGHLLLYNRELDLIDNVIYNEKMHHPLLAGTEGISLEKVRPWIESMNSEAWHSASESSGWGTPGSENSVLSPEAVGDDRISFSSGRLSPDNDGYEDVLVVDLNLEGIDNIVTVSIFDETGGFVRKISENFLAGSEASLIWDGTADDGTLVRTGIYIIFIELFNNKGKTASWKKVCTVIR
jgi:hypothetical protein